MMILDPIPRIEEILGTWKKELGPDFTGYRNHVYRMAHFCMALGEKTPEIRAKIWIAAAFHDLGIWSEGTVDYLEPSVALAERYLERRGQTDWQQEVGWMIRFHHKVRPFSDARFPLVERFRKADLVDVSLGLVRFGLPASLIREVKNHFPNAGFHKRLGELTVMQLKVDALNPLPMMKW